jgi:hypothetical protein
MLASSKKPLIAGIENRDLFDVLLIIGLSAAAGDLIFVGLFGDGGLIQKSLTEKLSFAAALAIASWVSVRFIDPFVERLMRGSTEQAEPTIRLPNRSVRSVYVAIILVAGFEALVAFAEHPSNFVVFLLSIPIPMVVTYFWIKGAQRERPQAAWFGAIGGGVAGGVWIGLVGLAVSPILSQQLGPQLTGLFFIVAIPFIALTVAIPAYVGGLAVDQRWGATVARGVTPALTVVTLLEWWFLFSRMYNFVPNLSEVVPMYQLLQPVLEALGWGFGLSLAGKAELMLRPPQ